MTVRLIRAFDGYPANAIVTLDRGTEAALVGQRAASFDLSGGVPFQANGALDNRPFPIAAVVSECEAEGADAGAGAYENAAAIQRALRNGGFVTLTRPGNYAVGESLLWGSDTTFYIGAGVRIYNGGISARNILRSCNAAWSGLDQHVLNCVTILCASPGQEGVGTVRYVYQSNTPITYTSVVYGAGTNMSNVAATLSYQAPGDSAAGPAQSIPAFPGGKMRLVSGNGVDCLWVSVGNGGKAGSQAALAQTFLPAANVTERVRIINEPICNPKPVTWTYATVGGKPVITVFEPNHGRQPGDKIEMLKGSGLEGLFEVYNIGNAVTYGNTGAGNTSSSSAWKNNNGSVPDFWTIIPNTAVNATYWSGLAASGSAIVHGVRNMHIAGEGIIDYNKDGFVQSALPQDNMGDGVIMNGVSDYSLDGVAVVGSYAHGFFQTNCGKGDHSPGHGFAPYGAMNPRGPIRDLRVRGTKGRSDDNNADCGTSDYAHFIIHFPNENCSIGQISATDVFDVKYESNNNDQNYEVTRIFTSLGSQLVGFTFRDGIGRSDEQATTGMNMLSDEALLPNRVPGQTVSSLGITTVPGGAGGFFEQILIANFAIKENTYFDRPAINLNPNVTFGRVVIDGIDLAQTNATTNPGAIAVGGTVDRLIIRNAGRRENNRARTGQGAYAGYIVNVYAGGLVRRLTLMDSHQYVTQAPSLGETGLVLINTGGTVTEVDVVDSTMVDANWEVSTATVSNGGTGYTNGETVTLTAGTNGSASATFTVTASAGVVSALTPTVRGSFYNATRPGIQADGVTSSAVAISGGTGTGLTATLTWLFGARRTLGFVVNKGTCGRIFLRNCEGLEADAMVYNAATSSLPEVIVTDSWAKANFVVNNNSTAALTSITLANLIGNGIRMVSGGHTSGTIPVRMSNCGRWIGSSTTRIAAGVGGLYNIYGWDFPIDLNSTTIPKTVAGQYALTSILAGTIPAGRLAVCDGTNWRCVDDRTLLF